MLIVSCKKITADIREIFWRLLKNGTDYEVCNILLLAFVQSTTLYTTTYIYIYVGSNYIVHIIMNGFVFLLSSVVIEAAMSQDIAYNSF